jgi:hypothetical protein
MKGSIDRLSRGSCAVVLMAMTACGGESDPMSAGASTLVVQVYTIGSLPDPDGYTVSLDDGAPMLVTDDDTLIIQSIAAGSHRVRVGGLAPNCATLGDSAQSARTSTDGFVGITFTIACYDPAIQGVLRVTAHGGAMGGGHGPFTLSIDGQNAGSLESIPPGSIEVPLAAGPHAVELKWKIDCGPTNSGPQRVIVPENGTGKIDFSIECI